MQLPRIARLGVVALLLALWAACGGNDGKLKVTGIEPRSGDAMGGQYVLIKGQNFQKEIRTAKVYFGETPGNVIRFRGDDELLVEAPGGKAGTTVDVMIVFEPGGELTVPKAYSFVEKQDVKVDDLKTK